MIRPTVANVADLLREQAGVRGDAGAVSDARRSLTWSELDAEADRVAAGLVQLGLVAGYRVAVSLTNRVEFVSCYLGILRAGLVAVPLNPTSPTGEVVRVLADSGARVVVCETDTAAAVRGAVDGLADALAGADEQLRARTVVPAVVVVDAATVPGEQGFDALLAAEPVTAVAPQDPHALAVLLYTSGTSGRPRAAMLSHLALLTNIEQAAVTTTEAMGPDDVVLGVLPLFHVYGLNGVLGQVLRQGARLLIEARFDAEQTLALVQREAATIVPVAPPVLGAWAELSDLAGRLTSVRLVVTGAGPMTPEDVRRFETAAGVQVHQGYGLTEAAPAVTSTLMSSEPKPGSVGKALPGVELRVLDEGHEVEGADAGEVWVRGGNLFDGYWPDAGEGPDADGWYATGDVGYLDADGDLFLVDRLKEIVIVSGFNVYPSEIEDVLAEVDGVVEAAVIGVPDAETGEAVVAYVVTEPHQGLDDARVAEQVRAHSDRRLARFKQPRDLHVVAELPRSVTGKVAKGRLRATEQRRAMGLA
ncbi:MAG: class I adenylate-forming enzyme family protein [Nocardioidaceae bacterium]